MADGEESPHAKWRLYRENIYFMVAKVLAGIYIMIVVNSYTTVSRIPMSDQRFYPQPTEGKLVRLPNGEISWKAGTEPTRCSIDTNKILENFVFYLILPCFIFRFYAFMKFRDAEDI